MYVPRGLEHLSDLHLWAVGSVTRWQARMGYLCERPQDEYVPLATAYLIPILGDDYRRVLDDLISREVLECDWEYTPPARGGKGNKGGGGTTHQDIASRHRDNLQFIGETVGGKCYGYRLGQRYRGAPLRPTT